VERENTRSKLEDIENKFKDAVSTIRVEVEGFFKAR
jgi:hypothetical protein